ncbi:MAG: PAS domain S-box protein [Methanobacteriaceae archaeon]|nr:PAS domain S-box protein [Methanobacteriaceae archaeon]
MEENVINWIDFFQAINHPALILDSSHHILAANKASQKYLGLPEDEIVGKLCFNLIHDADSDKAPFSCPLESLVKDGKAETVEMEMETFGGYALVSCTPVFDEKGNLDKIIHIATDITQRKKSEEALKRKEQQMSGLISNLPGVVYRCRNDENWTMEFISEQCKDLTGYNPSDFLYNKKLAYADIIHPEDQEMVWSEVQKAISMDKPFQIQYRIITRENEVKWVWERGFANRDDEKDLFLEGFIEDISIRKESEKALRESEENFRALFENSPMAMVTYDKNGNVKFFNRRFIELTGYTLDDMHSLNGWFSKAYPDPEYRELIQKKWAEKLGKKEKDTNSLPLIADIKCKNGDIKTVEFYGATMGEDTITILNDITHKKIAEKRLKESQQRLNDIIEFLPDATLVIDDKGVVTSWNRALEELTGVQSEDMVGKGDYEYALPFYGERRPILIDLVRKSDAEIQNKYSFLEREGNIILGETKGFIKGDERILWGKAAPLYDSQGNFKGSIETIRDITERRKYEENLQKSEEKYKNMVKELKIAEKALKESERSYRELVDNSLVGIFKTNLDGRILFANEAMARMFHYDSAEELKGINIIKVYSNQDDRFKLLQELEKNGRATDYEVQAKGKDGQKVNVLVSASLEDGVLSGMFMDITERKKSELKLKEKEEQIRAIFNTVKSGIMLVDKEGVIDFANQHMIEMFGYELSELIGMSYLDLTSDSVRKEAEKSMLTLIKGEVDYVLLERLYRRKDGTIFWGQISANRLLKDDGTLKGLIGVITDISDRKKWEEKLKESEEKYRTVVDTAGEVIILFDNKANILEANQKALQLFGFSKKELVGKNLLAIAPQLKINLKEALSSFKDVLMGKDISKTEWNFTNLRGEEKIVVAHYTRLKKGKKTIGITLLLEDITERKKAEDKIKESLKEKEVLLREIHHRVKNNMQIISSLLNLQIKFEDLDETVGVLKESQGRVKSMAMVHEKLYQSDSFSKINFKDYLTNLVSDIFYSYNIQKEKIGLELDIKDVNIGIDTAIPLGLIINELVTNSVKYAFPDDRKGKIGILFKYEDDSYVLIIYDDGVGVPEDIELEKTETLGLQLVTSLVNQLDGSIKLDRVNGTKYTLKFKELKYKDRL